MEPWSAKDVDETLALVADMLLNPPEKGQAVAFPSMEVVEGVISVLIPMTRNLANDLAAALDDGSDMAAHIQRYIDFFSLLMTADVVGDNAEIKGYEQ